MNIHELNYVLCIAKHQNMTKAAQELFISQPTLSKHLGKLERELGVKLFTLSKTRDLVLAAVIAAIIVIMAFVPFLGYIPLGFMNATTVHIPVIIGAIILGPKYGAFLGLTFGLTSLWKNTFMPNPTSFVFSPFVTMGQFHGNLGSLVICLVPRILIGVVAYYVYRLFMRTLKNRRNKQGTALFAAGVAGSLTNTLLVI